MWAALTAAWSWSKVALKLIAFVEAIFKGLDDAEKKRVTARLIESKIFNLNEAMVQHANQAEADAAAAIAADPNSLRREP